MPRLCGTYCISRYERCVHVRPVFAVPPPPTYILGPSRRKSKSTGANFLQATQQLRRIVSCRWLSSRALLTFVSCWNTWHQLHLIQSFCRTGASAGTTRSAGEQTIPIFDHAHCLRPQHPRQLRRQLSSRRAVAVIRNPPCWYLPTSARFNRFNYTAPRRALRSVGIARCRSCAQQ